MKYLLIIIVVLAVLWLASRSRARVQQREDKPEQKRAGTESIEDMVTCAYCQVHLPKSEALAGRAGYYCDASHRAAHESKEASR